MLLPETPEWNHKEAKCSHRPKLLITAILLIIIIVVIEALDGKIMVANKQV